MIQANARIVVSGMGMITPLGLTTQTTWSRLLKGDSGIRSIIDEHPQHFSTQFGGQLPSFKLDKFKTRQINRMDPMIQYGLQAAKEAIENAQLFETNIDFNRVGVSIGSGLGGLQLIEQQHQKILQAQPKTSPGLRQLSPFFVPGMLNNMLSGICSIEYGFKGPNFSVVSACATGGHNLALGAQCIANNQADIMIVGGSDQGTSTLSRLGFSACRALSKRNDCPQAASRPWDIDRDGFVLSDGAAVLVLERYEHAKARNASIYGELKGFGMTADAYDLTAPEPSARGIIQAMRQALTNANIAPSQVDYINAHATSTPLGDIVELKAFESVWGDAIQALKISSTKSMTGHLLGASGALEAAFCLLAIRDQVAPPTINLDNIEPRFSHLNLVPHVVQSASIKIALSNAFGFGGTNSSLIFSAIE